MVIAATLLALVILILVVNAARLRSKQIRVPRPENVDIDEKESADHLSRAIQLKTVSREDPAEIDPQPFLRLHGLLEKAFPRTHRTLKREVVGELSLLYTWKATDPAHRPFLLMSHIDVVPVEPESEAKWTHPPFAGQVADGYIWGRGALDVKCGAVALLQAVEFLLAKGFRPACTIYIALGHDEEIGGRNGNAKIAALLKQRGVRLRYVLDEGGAILHGGIKGVSSPVAFIGVAEKGHLGVRLSAWGPKGHASMPPRQTAVGILAAAIAKVESHPVPARLSPATELMLNYLGPEMPFPLRMILANRWLFGGLIRRWLARQPATSAIVRTTAAATTVEGGVGGNVLPTTATAYVDFRLLPGDTGQSVLKYLERTLSDGGRVRCSPDGPGAEASAVSDTDARDFAALHRTIRELFPGAVVAPGLTTVTTDSRHYEAITDNTFRFIPTRLTPEDLRRIHATDERISVKNYLEIIRFFIRQIRNSASEGQRTDTRGAANRKEATHVAQHAS